MNMMDDHRSFPLRSYNDMCFWRNMLNIMRFEKREHRNIYECHFLSEVVLIEPRDLAVAVIRTRDQPSPV